MFFLKLYEFLVLHMLSFSSSCLLFFDEWINYLEGSQCRKGYSFSSSFEDDVGNQYLSTWN